jgi:hypothetical protein
MSEPTKPLPAGGVYKRGADGWEAAGPKVAKLHAKIVKRYPHLFKRLAE